MHLTRNAFLDIYNKIVDIHCVFMDDHDQNCCELWISVIIIDIHNSIIDIHSSIMDICNCIMGNIFEELMDFIHLWVSIIKGSIRFWFFMIWRNIFFFFFRQTVYLNRVYKRPFHLFFFFFINSIFIGWSLSWPGHLVISKMIMMILMITTTVTTTTVPITITMMVFFFFFFLFPFSIENPLYKVVYDGGTHRHGNSLCLYKIKFLYFVKWRYGNSEIGRHDVVCPSIVHSPM